MRKTLKELCRFFLWVMVSCIVTTSFAVFAYAMEIEWKEKRNEAEKSQLVEEYLLQKYALQRKKM